MRELFRFPSVNLRIVNAWVLLLGLALGLCSLWGIAGEKVSVNLKQAALSAPTLESWKPNSTIARSVTGSVNFTGTKVTFENGAALFLTQYQQESDFGESEREVHATIYKVKNPSDPKLLNGNRLCGFGEHEFPVKYIAVWTPVSGSANPAQERVMGVYTTDQPPKTIHGGSQLCHDFRYLVN